MGGRRGWRCHSDDNGRLALGDRLHESRLQSGGLLGSTTCKNGGWYGCRRCWAGSFGGARAACQSHALERCCWGVQLTNEQVAKQNAQVAELTHTSELLHAALAAVQGDVDQLRALSPGQAGPALGPWV
jgi:hypothetical protein